MHGQDHAWNVFYDFWLVKKTLADDWQVSDDENLNIVFFCQD